MKNFLRCLFKIGAYYHWFPGCGWCVSVGRVLFKTGFKNKQEAKDYIEVRFGQKG